MNIDVFIGMLKRYGFDTDLSPVIRNDLEEIRILARNVNNNITVIAESNTVVVNGTLPIKCVDHANVYCMGLYMNSIPHSSHMVEYIQYADKRMTAFELNCQELDKFKCIVSLMGECRN